MEKHDKKMLNKWPKNNNNVNKRERAIPLIYPAIDTDLARDNIENDLTAADIQDLEK